VEYAVATTVANSIIVERHNKPVVYRKLYPCIGHHDAGCIVRVNFGEEKFAWTGGQNSFHRGKATK
jgi:hypothetical protein